MPDQQPWPAPTPRDEMLARVTGAGKKRIMRNRFIVGGGVIAAFGIAAAGFAAGHAGTVDLLGEKSVTVTDAVAPYSACPNQPAIGELHRGDRIFVTGRSDDGTWLEIRSPADSAERAWVAKAIATADSSVDGLPVHGCSTPGQLALPGQTTTTTTPPEETTTTTTTVPGQTTTTRPGSSSTTTPTTQATTTTTAKPDTTPPSVGQGSSTPDMICESPPPSGWSATSTVTAFASDAGGIASVTVRWTSSSVNGSAAMNHTTGNQYSGTVGPFPASTLPMNQHVVLTITVEARDNAGNVASTAAGTVTLWDQGGCIV